MTGSREWANFDAFSRIFSCFFDLNPTMLDSGGQLAGRLNGAGRTVSLAAGAGTLLSVLGTRRRPVVRNLS
jgi:hypothetical protein